MLISGNLSGSGSANINWLVTDQLGTPRMVFDKTGALATTKRHDYLPFGEDLSAGQGARTTALGYGMPDGVRQKFTLKERDNETGLDFFKARYYASTQGRFTSTDPILIAEQKLFDPQQWNMYSYTRNNPTVLLDPTGKYVCSTVGAQVSSIWKIAVEVTQNQLPETRRPVSGERVAEIMQEFFYWQGFPVLVLIESLPEPKVPERHLLVPTDPWVCLQSPQFYRAQSRPMGVSKFHNLMPHVLVPSVNSNRLKCHLRNGAT